LFDGAQRTARSIDRRERPRSGAGQTRIMKTKYDIVVVGSGHNGLVAAAFLAKAGKQVLVLERNGNLGGGTVTSELTAPGFRHDRHSALHIIIQANPLIRNDELGLIAKFGLQYCYPEAIFSTVFEDHDSVITYADLNKTCQSIARISPRDAEAYRKFAEKSGALLPLFIQGMFVPPPPQGAFWALLDQSTDGQELMHVMQKSMLDIVNEHFHHDKIKVHLLKAAAELLVAPDEKGSGAFIFNMAGFAHKFPWGVPIGGSAALVDALVRCLKFYGAEFLVESEVEKILVANGKTTGVRLKNGEKIAATTVIGQIHPWLLGDMVEDLDPHLVRRARNTKTATFSLMSAMYALKEAPRFATAPEATRAALVNFAPSSLEAYLRVFDDLRYGDLPGRPVLATHEHSQWDATRAPTGGATLTVCTFCPFHLRDGGSAAWDTRKPEFQHYVHEMAGRLCTNLTEDNIVATAFDSPADAARYSPTFQQGDVGGLGKFFYQVGGHRPTPELSQYAVPGADGLYLAGTFMHPPGGVTGGGRATAIRICDDLGIDFDGLCTAPR
jgi:phytoene dehydrogenase-like protein